MECEVKWALGSITMNKAGGGDGIPDELLQVPKDGAVKVNKAGGGDGIPVELLQVPKDGAVKVLHSICQQIWKNQQWPQDWKRKFSFQSQRKAMPKNAQTTAQLHSFHTLVK